MVPVNLALIYRIFTRKDFTQYEFREKYASYWDCLNILDINPYKKRPKVDAINDAIQKKSDTKRPFLEEDNVDKFFKSFLGFCILYYVADCLIKLYEFKAEDYRDVCKMGFFAHHLATIFGFKSIFFVDHYTWFFMGPMAYHTVIVTFPDLTVINNMIYAVFVIAFAFYPCFALPFRKRKISHMLFLTSIFIVIPLILLSMGNCMQDFDW
jgi:hypothetical protein